MFGKEKMPTPEKPVVMRRRKTEKGEIEKTRIEDGVEISISDQEKEREEIEAQKNDNAKMKRALEKAAKEFIAPESKKERIDDLLKKVG